MKKIDCHTHIVNPVIRDEYFRRTDGYALVMQMPERLMHNPDTVATVQSDPRLFLCAAVDLKEEILPQLAEIEKHLEAWKVVGLKFYLTYQTAKANDARMYPAYEFAAKHGLGVTFHTGTCSLVLPSDQYLEGSDSKYIAQVAGEFPEVGFVAAHMDDPRLYECAANVAAHPNFFTDFSGLYEPGYAENDDIEGAIAKYGAAIHSQQGMEDHILYGTDFCPPINLSCIDEYEYSLGKMFAKKDLDKIYCKNCMRAFPRLAKLTEEIDNE